jgi:2-C-methyl-D-erythritol 4-phosphate cytidylyltransferase
MAERPAASPSPTRDADAPVAVDAIVLAAGSGERLGLGPKALLTLGGRTLLERAIAVMQCVAQRVIVGVPEDCVERIGPACAGNVLVLAGGKTRMETTLRLFDACTAPLIVQHDVVHPFVTAELARRVVAAARRRGAAMTAERAGAHVYRGGAEVTERIATAGGLWLAQKPLAFSRAALARALERSPLLPDGAGTPDLLLATGQPIEIVPGEPWNIKLTTQDDWALAQAIHPLLADGALGERLSPSRAEDGGEGAP